MLSLKEFERYKDILSHHGGDRYRDEWGQHHITLRPIELLDWMEFLKEDLGFLTLIDITAIEMGKGFEIVYQLLNMGAHQRLNLHLLIHNREVLPSIVHFYANADWLEREQGELLKLNFEFERAPLLTPEKKEPELPELRYNPNKSEAPYPEESYVWKNFDLLSPHTMGNFEWMVCFDPHKVVESKLRIGFHHQGFEKLLESKDIFQISQLIDKLNFSSSPSFSIVWAKTIEEQFHIPVPERAQAVRIVLLELARICDHLTVMASVCKETEQNEFALLLDAREKIYELFEKFAGHRHCIGIVKMGGMKQDLPPGWIVEYQNASDVLAKNLLVIHNTLTTRQTFRDKLQGDSLNAHAVLQLGVTGPAMRAAGLNFDLRKSNAFYFYQDIDFDIPVGIHGTTYERYLIRHEEIFQSLRIITQVIDNLPLGEFITPEFDKNYLELHHLFSQMKRPHSFHYSPIESPSGEAGFLVKFDGDLKPQRIKMKTPGFTLAQAIPVFTRGLREEQLTASLASFGLSRWEMDR